MTDTICQNEGTVSREHPTWVLMEIEGGAGGFVAFPQYSNAEIDQ